jgi:hypothetical protein
VHALQLKRKSSKDVRHIYYVYTLGERAIGSPLELQLKAAWAALTGHSAPVRLIAVASDGGTLPAADVVEILSALASTATPR